MRAFFPGRFQPFHEGHRELVDRILDDAEEVVVAIGSAGLSHTEDNPFTAGERVSMVHRTLDEFDATTFVIPITNVEPYALWPAHVQALSPPFDAVYSNNPTVRRVVTESGYEARGIELIERDRYSGTEIRRRMVAGEPWRDLVPDPVAAVVDELDGPERVREVRRDDG
jgi:nicotinamide-nucleotide adenylyltransferase